MRNGKISYNHLSKQGCDAYLAYVADKEKRIPNIK